MVISQKRSLNYQRNNLFCDSILFWRGRARGLNGIPHRDNGRMPASQAGDSGFKSRRVHCKGAYARPSPPIPRASALLPGKGPYPPYQPSSACCRRLHPSKGPYPPIRAPCPPLSTLPPARFREPPTKRRLGAVPSLINLSPGSLREPPTKRWIGFVLFTILSCSHAFVPSV